MSDIRGDAVFCDEIRQEGNGKHFLIGVYGVDLVPSALPAAFPISLWVRIHGLSLGEHNFRVQLSSPSGPHLEVGGKINVSTPEVPSIFSLVGLPVELRAAGDLVAMFATDGGNEFEVGRLRVVEPARIQRTEATTASSG